MKVINRNYNTHVLSKDNSPCARIVAGDLVICQTVNPMKTVRMEIPRYITRSYGFDSISAE